MKDFFKKVDCEKKSADNKKSMQNYPKVKKVQLRIVVSLLQGIVRNTRSVVLRIHGIYCALLILRFKG